MRLSTATELIEAKLGTSSTGQMKSYYHVTRTKDLPAIMAHGLQPKIGHRSAKLGEKSNVFLFNSESSMHDGFVNWLGDEFPEDEKLTAIKVDLPTSHPVKPDPDIPDSHSYTSEPIHPKYLKIHPVEL